MFYGKVTDLGNNKEITSTGPRKRNEVQEMFYKRFSDPQKYLVDLSASDRLDKALDLFKQKIS